MDPITAYQITSMLQGAVSRGTSARTRRLAQPQPRRQDRHHQRGQGRLVHRLQPAHRRGLLHGLRHPAPDGRQRLRRHALRPDLPGVHRRGDGGPGSGEVGGAAGRLLHQGRPPHRPAAVRQRQRRRRAGRVHPRRPGADRRRRVRPDRRRRLEDGRRRAAVHRARNPPRRRSSGCRSAARAARCRRTPPAARCRAAGSTDAWPRWTMRDWSAVGPDEVLAFWFPDDGHERDAAKPTATSGCGGCAAGPTTRSATASADLTHAAALRAARPLGRDAARAARAA